MSYVPYTVVNCEIREVVSYSSLGADGTFSFSSLDGSDFDRYEIIAGVRSDYASTQDNALLTVNGDTTASNYLCSYRWDGLSATAGNYGQRNVGEVTAANATANMYGMLRITIIGGDGTTWNTNIFSRATEPRSTTVGRHNECFVQWNNTAEITSLDLDPQSGTNFVAGSHAVLIGVRRQDVLVKG